jgi:hypothetical protein
VGILIVPALCATPTPPAQGSFDVAQKQLAPLPFAKGAVFFVYADVRKLS